MIDPPPKIFFIPYVSFFFITPDFCFIPQIVSLSFTFFKWPLFFVIAQIFSHDFLKQMVFHMHGSGSAWHCCTGFAAVEREFIADLQCFYQNYQLYDISSYSVRIYASFYNLF